MFNHKIVRIGNRFEVMVNKDGHTIRRKMFNSHEEAVRWATHQLGGLRARNDMVAAATNSQPQGVTAAEAMMFNILAREYVRA